jgi:hypothetical protein
VKFTLKKAAIKNLIQTSHFNLVKLLVVVAILGALGCQAEVNQHSVSPQNIVLPMSGGVLTYGPASKNVHNFGQWLVFDATATQYCMFIGISSSIVCGRPSNSAPGDTNSFNPVCKTWWADRIWLLRHSGDGRDAKGWGQPDLVLTIGGEGESALIGDPCAVFWQGQWHMYYEGTDDCQGGSNRIYHATAASLSGPWRKQGAVRGLQGNYGGSGLSWPTVLVDGKNLLLYYTDGWARLLCARSQAADGQQFETVNFDPGQPTDRNNPAAVVPGEWVNRGQVVKVGDRYLLVYDAGMRTAIKASLGKSPLAFAPGVQIATTNQNAWESLHVGLPCVLQSGTECHIYYTGESTNAPGCGGIGVFPVEPGKLN